MFGKDHELEKSVEMTFACKKCKKVFRKEVTEDFDDADEHCPHCDNHFMIEAKTPENTGHLVIGFEMQRGHEGKQMIDEREK